MSILQAIGFMVLGGAIVEIFELHAWRRYQQGKREGGFLPPHGNRRGEYMFIFGTILGTILGVTIMMFIIEFMRRYQQGKQIAKTNSKANRRR